MLGEDENLFLLSSQPLSFVRTFETLLFDFSGHLRISVHIVVSSQKNSIKFTLWFRIEGWLRLLRGKSQKVCLWSLKKLAHLKDFLAFFHMRRFLSLSCFLCLCSSFWLGSSSSSSFAALMYCSSLLMTIRSLFFSFFGCCSLFFLSLLLFYIFLQFTLFSSGRHLRQEPPMFLFVFLFPSLLVRRTSVLAFPLSFTQSLTQYYCSHYYTTISHP